MQLDRNGLEVLSRRDCLELLRASAIGRVVVTDRALPAAFPVNFALLDDDVVFLTAPGSKLDAATVGAVVAFEVDDVDAVHRTGWSVLVQGRADVVGGADLERARLLALHPWTAAAPAIFVRVRSEVVSGRRLRGLAPATADRGRAVRERGPM